MEQVKELLVKSDCETSLKPKHPLLKTEDNIPVDRGLTD